MTRLRTIPTKHTPSATRRAHALSWLLCVAGCVGGGDPAATRPSPTTTLPGDPEDTTASDSTPEDPPLRETDAATTKPTKVASADAGPAMPAVKSADGGHNVPSPATADGGDGGEVAPAGPPPAKLASCLDDITDYQNPGPFKFEMKTAGKVKLWLPTVPAGCKVPVVHMANGTTANCGNYQKAIERLATHGFLTTCYEDPNTGAGTYGVMAFEAALSMYPDLADNKLGSTGHSQGGQAALVTLQLAETKWADKMTYAGLAMEPASGYGTQPKGGTWQSFYAKVKSPVFLFSGDSSTGYSNSKLVGMSTGDGLVGISWVNEGFEALSKSVEAYHWTSHGATHIPTPEGPEQQISIPWFRWKLLGDRKACEFFKKMPDGGTWKSQKDQNAQPCP